MSTISAVIVTLCAVFPTWLVLSALSIVTIVALIILIKIVAFVLDAVPFL